MRLGDVVRLRSGSRPRVYVVVQVGALARVKGRPLVRGGRGRVGAWVSTISGDEVLAVLSAAEAAEWTGKAVR